MWEERNRDGIRYFTVPRWQKRGAEVFFSSRLGGESRGEYESLNLALHVDDEVETVIANRRHLLEAVTGESSFVTVQQTHSCHILPVGTGDVGRGFLDYDDAFADTDGLVTDTPSLLLATFYADCLPLACFDPKNKAIGMAHAGWRGTWQNIGGALIEMMTSQFGSDTKDLLVAIGAGIGPCCYEVHDNFYEQFRAVYGQADAWFEKRQNRRYYFDNIKANLDLLVAAGVNSKNIDILALCTCCRQDLFYSYRGSGGVCGRQGLFARIIP